MQGIDLYGASGQTFRFDIFDWVQLLSLAEKNGWEPAGTRVPLASDEDEDDGEGYDAAWDGSYAAPSGQEVSEADALALAQAIEDSLPTLARVKSDLDEIEDISALEPEEYFGGGTNAAYLAAFASFCREGKFSIC